MQGREVRVLDVLGLFSAPQKKGRARLLCYEDARYEDAKCELTFELRSVPGLSRRPA